MSTSRNSLQAAVLHDFALVVLSTKGGSVALQIRKRTAYTVRAML